MCIVTSYTKQGEVAREAKPVKDGAQGPIGEKGDAYYPEVILSPGIKTDVVWRKAADKYTLTFEGQGAVMKTQSPKCL